MQNALTSLLDKLVGKLPAALQPFAKAVIPGGVALGGAVVDALISGQVNTSSITIAASGLVLAIVTFLVPNKPQPAPAPAPAKAKPRARKPSK